MSERVREARAGRSARGVLVVLSALLALVVAACGVDARTSTSTGPQKKDPNVAGQTDTPPTSATTTTTTEPPSTPDLEINGDDGEKINDLVASAIVDLQGYWKTEYPEVYDGEEYQPVTGGFYAVDPQNDAEPPPCAQSMDDIAGNAFYCGARDVVAWDEAGLLPKLEKDYGSFTVAVVLAHEWGHAIQARSGFEAKTVTSELQADCFAGAWVKHVQGGDDPRFQITVADLDNALAGFLFLRDEPGSDAEDPSAHGSGFDRVSAFQDGLENDATQCATYTDGDPQPFEVPFSSEEEAANGGNLPYHELATDMFQSLEDYWAKEYPALSNGEDWKPLSDPQAFTTDDPPTCNGKSITGFSLFYCVPDDYVGYDDGATIPEIYDQGGDFSVGALFGTQYGLAVQYRLGNAPDDETASTLRGDCYAGAWAASLLPDGTDEQPLVLSSGDLDEAISALLIFRGDNDRERQGPGFARVRAFRIGVLNGAADCTNDLGQ